MSQSPSIRALEAFHAVVTLGSTAAAAEQLSITQPAITHLIRSLEDGTGLKLFRKQGRRLVLTGDGELYFEEVNRGLGALSVLKDSAAAIRSANQGHVRIVTVPMVADYLLGKAIATFREANPGLRISIEVTSQHSALVMLEARRADLAFLPEVPPEAYRNLGEMRSRAALIVPAAEAESANKSSALDILRKRDLITLNSGSPFRYAVDKYLREAGIPVQAGIEVATQSLIAQLVSLGSGVAIVDCEVARHHSHNVGVVELDPPLDWRVSLIARCNGRLSTAAQRLSDHLSSELFP
jgi:DNA-binding transcriptional LysR family regulator